MKKDVDYKLFSEICEAAAKLMAWEAVKLRAGSKIIDAENHLTIAGHLLNWSEYYGKQP